MVIVRLLNSGKDLDVVGRVGFTRQVGDIGDIGKVNSSYSWTLKFPKTDNNTRQFKGLGLVGSVSRFPYEEQKVSLIHNGVQISRGGDLHITETTESEYRGNIKEGIIEFLKGIEDDKLGEIDLSELQHERSFSTVINSFNNDLAYKYIVAGYNGKLLPDLFDMTNFDISSMIPSANCGYLLDKIFEHYGWEYEGLDVQDTWMTYPTADTEVGNWEVLRGVAISPETMESGYYGNIVFERTARDSAYVNAAEEFSSITVKASGNYAIKLPSIFWNTGQIAERTISIYIDNVLVESTTGNYDLGYLELNDVQEGSIINVRISAGESGLSGSVNYNGEFSLILLGVSDIDFSATLMDLSIRDFLKEMMMQTASVPIKTDVENKKIIFKTFKNRIEGGRRKIKRSDFIKRDEEKYVYRNYGQNNYFRHKYDGDNEDFNDGNLKINNENLKLKNTVYESLGYSPLKEKLRALFESDVAYLPILKMHDIKVNDNDGDIEIEYEPLDDRIHFLKYREINDGFYINSQKYFGIIPVAEPILWADIISSKDSYKLMDLIIQDARIIKIKSSLPEWKIADIEFDKVYYLESELGDFLINRATFDNEKGSEIELIKIN